MRTIQKTVYAFSELSHTAKERAIYDYKSHSGYLWENEAMASLRALAGHFGGALKDYSIDFFASSYSIATFDMPEMSEAEIADRLDKLGFCTLTGFAADEDAIDGFRAAFYKGERDLKELMHFAFFTWLKSAQEDCAEFYTEAGFGEHADANDYEFLEDGDLFS